MRHLPSLLSFLLAAAAAVAAAGCSSSSGGTTCGTQSVDLQAPSKASCAAVGQGSRLSLGVGPCTARSAATCTYTLSGNVLSIAAQGEVCSIAPGVASCAVEPLTTFACDGPTLAAGTYRLGTAAFAEPLTVGADGSCHLGLATSDAGTD
jgi:hypothetical protein